MDAKGLDLEELLQRKGVLLGCAVDSGVLSFVEFSGRLGYDLTWIDLEHYSRSGSLLESFCITCEASGVLSTMRLSDASRTSILQALELGIRIVVIPMVNDAATAYEIVQHGKFAPLGNRGFNGGTRGLQYGLEDRSAAIRYANEKTYLFPQIETAEALDRLEEIVNVDGIAGALVGPADLSISLGMPLDFTNPKFIECYQDAIRRVRACGKIAATATGHAGLIGVALEAGLQILVGASDIVGVRDYMRGTLADLQGRVRATQSAQQTAQPSI